MAGFMPSSRRSASQASIAGRLRRLASTGGEDRRRAAAGEDRRRAPAPAVRNPRGRPRGSTGRRPPSSIRNPGRVDLNVPAPDPDVAVEGLRLICLKELTLTDVGPLRRIVLPKNSAEVNLPVLKNKGKNLRMHDIETFQLWEFTYKFWPNNKGRMYLLENTGQYIEAHALQAGDFIMIYKDDAAGHLMIRSKKRVAEQVNNTPQFDGIFDSIEPDFNVAEPRYSELFSPSTQGTSGPDLSLAFQPLPFSDEAGSTSGTSAPLPDWSPSSSHL